MRRYRRRPHFRAVNGDQLGHRGDRRDQANPDHDGDSDPCAQLHFNGLDRGSHIFRDGNCECVARGRGDDLGRLQVWRGDATAAAGARREER